MKRLLVVLTALAIGTMPAIAFADQAASAKAKPKTMTASGEVSAVAPDSLTVKSKTAEWTFTIDKQTTVTAKGATHKSLALKADNKATTLNNFVKVGDLVTVSYHDMGTSKHAASIKVK